MEITEGHLLVRLEDSAVGEGELRTMVPQVEVEGTLGEEVVPTRAKLEVEVARIAVVIFVLV